LTTQAPTGAWNTYPAAAAQFSWTDSAGNANLFTFDCVVDETWNEPATVTEHPVENGANVADHVRVELRKVTLKVWATNEPIDANNWDEATVGPVSIDVAGPSWTPGPGTIIVPEWDNNITLKSIAGSLVGIAGAVVGNAVGGGNAGGLIGDVAAIAGLEAADLLLPGERTKVPVQTDAGIQPTSGRTIQAQVQQWPGGSDGIDYVAKTISALQTLKNNAQQIDVIGSKSFCSPMTITGLTTVRNADTGTGADITIELTEVRIVQTQTVAVPIPNLPAGGGNVPQQKGQQDPSDSTPQKQQSVAKLLANFISGASGGGLSFLLPGPP
jgi:hypothetical protein